MTLTIEIQRSYLFTRSLLLEQKRGCLAKRKGGVAPDFELMTVGRLARGSGALLRMSSQHDSHVVRLANDRAA